MYYDILNDVGEVINTIVSDLAFMEEHYPGHFRERPDIHIVDVPQVVSPFQAKAALRVQGLLLEVETLINDPECDPFVKLAWETAQEFRRTSPTILHIAVELNWTDKQLDDLFILAATIEA